MAFGTDGAFCSARLSPMGTPVFGWLIQLGNGGLGGVLLWGRLFCGGRRSADCSAGSPLCGPGGRLLSRVGSKQDEASTSAGLFLRGLSGSRHPLRRLGHLLGWVARVQQSGDYLDELALMAVKQKQLWRAHQSCFLIYRHSPLLGSRESPLVLFSTKGSTFSLVD